MSIKPEDYVCYTFAEDPDRVLYGQALEVGKTIKVVREKGRHTDSEQTDHIQESDVLVNLGPLPRYGTVYGHLVEPLRRSKQHSDFAIRIYRPFTKIEYQSLTAGLDRTQEWLQELGLNALLPIDLEIRHKKGKYAGHYTTGEDSDVIVSRLPEHTEAAVFDLLSHEFGHGIIAWFMDDRLRANWLTLYHKYTTRATIDLKDLTKVWREWRKSELTVSGFRAEAALESEEKLVAFDLCLDYVAEYHLLSAKELWILVEAGRDIDHLAPTVDMVNADQLEPLTEYANKSWEEFFCEALRLHAGKQKLPASIEKAVTATLERVRGSSK